MPEAGWVDFDPTNGLMPSDEHITVALGRDYDDVSPVSGVLLGGGRQRIDVAVDVALAG
jgi:transglutaminase-like putative cysteine protease